MFDNLKGELTDFHSKAAERAEKADYYRKTLETERAHREQVDQQVIELLHNVKDRYDTKLNGYMAKNKTKATNKNHKEGQNSNVNKRQGDWEWGASNDNQDEPETNVCNTTWDQNDDAQNVGDESPSTNAWGNNVSSPASKEDDKPIEETWGDGWGASNKDNETKGKPSKDTWGHKDESSKSKNDKPAKDCWNQKTPSPKANSEKFNKDDWANGWGNSNKDDKADTKADSMSTSPKKVDGREKSPCKKKNDTDDNVKSESQKNKKSNQKDNDNKKKEHQAEKKDPTPSTSKQDKSPAKKSEEPKTENVKENAKKNKSNNVDESKNETSERTELDNKELLELKSKIWTTKLDMRLLERDKNKLSEENAELKKERDDILRKLDLSSRDGDQLRVKMRGLTVDLVSANEEIHKLNERIDELEAEKRNRERDVSFTENRRKSIENKYKAYQQQIADQHSEIKQLKDERDDFERKFVELSRRNERLENDLTHSKALIRTLRDGCTLVENQVKHFEVRHDTVVMTKSDLERELIAIKEESSRHITTINKLQKSNEQISKAFIMSAEAHDLCKKEVETLQVEYHRKLEDLEIQNIRLSEANKQLRKVVDHLQNKR